MATVDEIQNNKYSDAEYEVFDPELQAWVEPSKSCYHKKRSTGFPDPLEALEPIVLIQFWDTKEEKGYVLGLEPWYYQEYYKYDFDLEYIKYNSEKELLQGFYDLFRTLDPLFIYAWNGENFDYPTLFNRLKKNKLPTLSNYGHAKLKTSKLDNGQIVNDITSDGHLFMDMMVVYKKFIYDTVQSYSLDFIGEKETGVSKVDHSNYLKFDDFRTGKYVITNKESEEQKKTKLHKVAMALESLPENHAKRPALEAYVKEKSYSDFVHYGVMDFVILKGIHDARNFTKLLVNMADQMRCLIPDTLGTLKAWDTYITDVIYRDKLITPPKVSSQDASVVGGFVRQSEIGKHKWILSSDVNSMYPLLGMAAHNMSPETFIPFDQRPADMKAIDQYLGTEDEDAILALSEEAWDEIKTVAEKYNVSTCPGGAIFRKDEMGVIPKLVTDIYTNRKKAKGEMFQWEQKAIDIQDELHRRSLRNK